MEGKDAVTDLTFYDTMTAPIVGRARSAQTAQTNHWGIVD